MKQVLFILITFFISANLMAKIQISGVIKSAAGIPIERADVVVLEISFASEPIATATTDKNGNYKIILPDAQPQLQINYVAPNHSVLQVPIICLPNQNYVIDVNLSPFYFDKISDTVSVIGNFNNFSRTENTIPMTKLESGIYTAKIPNPRDTLGYQILFTVKDTMGWQNTETGVRYFIEDMPRTINGQRTDFYKPVKNFGMRGASGLIFNYISHIISNEKEIFIEFDPTKITTQQPSATIKSDNPAIEKIFLYEDTMQLLDKERRERNWAELTEEETNTFRYEPTNKISSWFANATEDEFKTFLAINYVDNFWGDANDLNLDKNIINYISTNYPLNYFFLSGNFLHLCAIESDLNNEDLLSNKRLQKHLEEVDKTSGAYAYLLERITAHYMHREDTATAKMFYSILATSFSDHPSTFAIERWFNFSSGSRRIAVGNMIPDFELPNIDNSDEMISMQKLRGKWVLIDVWHRNCGPCLAEIPNLKVMYEKYKSKNFEIFGISLDSPEVLKQFKSIPRFATPWLHSSAKGSDVVKLLETVGVPHYILVAPDGKIASVGFELRGSRLEKTLENFLR